MRFLGTVRGRRSKLFRFSGWQSRSVKRFIKTPLQRQRVRDDVRRNLRTIGSRTCGGLGYRHLVRYGPILTELYGTGFIAECVVTRVTPRCVFVKMKSMQGASVDSVFEL